MKRRVLSLLLALCLIIGLLPAVTVHHAHAADAVLTEMIRFNHTSDIKASTDGKCTYLVNEVTEMTDSGGDTFTGSTF